MPEWRVPVFVEGAVDRTVLEQLRDAGGLSETLDLPRRNAAASGKDQVLTDLAANVAGGLRAIALVDYDEHGDAASLAAWVQTRLTEELKKLGSQIAFDIGVVAGRLIEIRPAAGQRAIV